jgi:hypothetical protein
MCPIVVTNCLLHLLLVVACTIITAITVARTAIDPMIVQRYDAEVAVRRGNRSTHADAILVTIARTDSLENDLILEIVINVIDPEKERPLSIPSTTEGDPTPLAGLRVPTNLRDVLLLLAETQRVMMVTIDSYHHQS